MVVELFQFENCIPVPKNTHSHALRNLGSFLSDPSGARGLRPETTRALLAVKISQPGLAGPRFCQNVGLSKTRILDARFARDCRPSAVGVCGFFFEGNRNR